MSENNRTGKCGFHGSLGMTDPKAYLAGHAHNNRVSDNGHAVAVGARTRSVRLKGSTRPARHDRLHPALPKARRTACLSAARPSSSSRRLGAGGRHRRRGAAVFASPINDRYRPPGRPAQTEPVTLLAAQPPLSRYRGHQAGVQLLIPALLWAETPPHSVPLKKHFPG